MSLKLACCVALVSSDDYIYAVNRRNQDIICFPGGKADEDESIIQCTLRELYEETGIGFIRANTLVPVYSGFCFGEPGDVESAYWCTAFGVKLDTNRFKFDRLYGPLVGYEEGITGRWVHVDDYLSQCAFHNFDKHVIQNLMVMFNISSTAVI